MRGLRPRLTPGQARRIDRLSRRAHRFHRFAHHPLCDRYAGEVVRVGRRVRLCRGCALAVAGGLAGGATGLVLGASSGAALAALAAATLLLVPTVASRRRLPKLVTRLAPAALFALAITTSVLAWQPLISALAIALIGGLRVLYGRRGGDRTPCQTCPERTLSPCSGFAPIVRREQAFQRVVRRMLA
ncbi:MAG TPA: hypothetical protein VFK02_35320 [Kofleriaceae bacterium]|nr:hypothetical protein [Kofleriaceae bacterium]